MIIRELNNINNASLHDAILLLTLTHPNSFINIYVDPNKECCISFKGELSEKDIQSFFFNLNTNLTCDNKIEDERIEYDVDYTYYNNKTEIFTKEGWEY